MMVLALIPYFNIIAQDTESQGTLVVIRDRHRTLSPIPYVSPLQPRLGLREASIRSFYRNELVY